MHTTFTGCGRLPRQTSDLRPSERRNQVPAQNPAQPKMTAETKQRQQSLRQNNTWTLAQSSTAATQAHQGDCDVRQRLDIAAVCCHIADFVHNGIDVLRGARQNGRSGVDNELALWQNVAHTKNKHNNGTKKTPLSGYNGAVFELVRRVCQRSRTLFRVSGSLQASIATPSTLRSSP